MAQVTVYNQQGVIAGMLDLSDAIFAIKVDEGVVHEAVLAQRANARRAIANAKTRGEIRGGGRKPWRQKGTGRARQGSIRSPQWVGGGIVFGPSSERNFSVKINKKTKHKALFMALSDKLREQKLCVLETFTTEPAKTKRLAVLLNKLPLERSVLLVVPGAQPMLMRMARNLPHVKLVSSNSVNIVDVLAHRSVIFFKDAVPMFEGLYRA